MFEIMIQTVHDLAVSYSICNTMSRNIKLQNHHKAAHDMVSSLSPKVYQLIALMSFI